MYKASLCLVLILCLLLVPNATTASDPASLIRIFGEFGSGEGQFHTPVSVLVFGEQLYVSDAVNDRVEIFDLDWNFVNQFNSTVGGAVGALDSPYGMETNGTHIFVTDYFNDRVTIHDMTGEYITEFGNTGSSVEILDGPVDLIFGDGRILVSSYISSHVKIYNATTFEYMYSIGQSAAVGTYGILDAPWGLTISESKLYVADNGNGTIKSYDISNGDFLGYADIVAPKDLMYVNEYVVATSNDDQLYIFDDNLNLIDVIRLGDALDLNVVMFDITATKLYLVNSGKSNIREYKLVAGPMNLVALAGDNGVSVSWEIQPELGLTAPTYYKVYREDTGGLTFLGTTQDQRFVDVATTAGDEYNYLIKAVSIIGESEMISTETVTIPPNIQQSGISVTTETVTEKGDSNPLPMNIVAFSAALLALPLIIRRKR